MPREAERAGAPADNGVGGAGLSRMRGAWRCVPFGVRMALRFALLLAAVSFVTFALVSASPIDPVQANVGQTAYLTMSPERRAALAERWGAGAGLLERYGAWLADALRGDFGMSLRYNAPVVTVVAERLAASAVLLAAAWLISGVLGFALGVVAGVCRGSRAAWRPSIRRTSCSRRRGLQPRASLSCATSRASLSRRMLSCRPGRLPLTSRS